MWTSRLFVDTPILYMKRMKGVAKVGTSAIGKRLEHESRQDPNFRGYGRVNAQAKTVDSRYDGYIPPKRKAISPLDHKLRLEGDRPGQFPGAKRRSQREFSALAEIFEFDD